MPENPKKFVAELLQQLIDNKVEFYSDDEIQILFKKFEVLDRGSISKSQCEKALRDIGIHDSIINSLQLNEQVSEQEFIALAKKALAQRVLKWKGQQ